MSTGRRKVDRTKEAMDLARHVLLEGKRAVLAEMEQDFTGMHAQRAAAACRRERESLEPLLRKAKKVRSGRRALDAALARVDDATLASAVRDLSDLLKAHKGTLRAGGSLPLDHVQMFTAAHPDLFMPTGTPLPPLQHRAAELKRRTRLVGSCVSSLRVVNALLAGARQRGGQGPVAAAEVAVAKLVGTSVSVVRRARESIEAK